MSDQIEPNQKAAVKAVRKVSKMFSDQALALDRIVGQGKERGRKNATRPPKPEGRRRKFAQANY